mgnify:CR=1 FL=1
MILVHSAPSAFGFSGAEVLFALSIAETSYGTIYPSITKSNFYGFFPSHTFFMVLHLVKNQVDTSLRFMVFMKPLTPLFVIFKIMLGMLFQTIFFESLCRSFCQNQLGLLPMLLFSIQPRGRAIFQDHP